MFKNNKQSPIYLLKIIKQAFEINKKPFPWLKAISAAICVGVPVSIGLVEGQLRLGLLGGIGGFTYLYVFNQPYARRAKQIFFVAIGISLSVGLGTLAAPYPLLVILIVGLIGTIVTFIFGVLKIPGPAAIFFVLSFIMTTGMAIDPSAAPIRTAIVLISSLFAWIISMVGWFFNPHGPEIKALKEVYLALASFSETLSSENINDVRHRTVNALKESEETLLVGYIPWKNSFLFNRLSLLNEQANKLFLEMLELYSNGNNKLPKEFGEMLRELSMGIELKDGEVITIHPLHNKLNPEYHNFLDIIYDAEAIINIPLTYIGHGIKISKPSLKMKFNKACDKDSIVFINAVRYGIVLSISTMIAFGFHFNRPYWIPLSCAAVMSGSTIMATFHRAIQRSFGTIVGLIIAVIIFKLQPQGFMIVIINMLLTAITELFIVKNYAVAAVFITPNALLIAEASTQINNVPYFATTRIIDIMIGSIIGLIGIYITGHRSASSRLPGLMTKLIRSQARVIVRLTSNSKISNGEDIKWIKEKMEIDFVNFKTAYITALGEIPNNEKMLEMLWPAFFSLEHISYLLDMDCTTKVYFNLSDENLAELLLAFEKMAMAIEQKQIVQFKKIPIMNEIPKICEEINILQESLSIKVISIKNSKN
ncbi:FUSC family protein [Clostridium estertheticum]|uniref:FUSC family protein n=1 Tax=Clostridium estertheticum TaxID=238834 RepID=A0AA47I7C9_9CLOT|nr:FUSC family protein [Clostridium estertheticum]MBU3157325.1 FUSC family protein [Clostridium estertheticum]MBU3200988.1 FUSC family protein [Clostridium estertheticum]WAG62497.1 FUSC family protein [Clostridium estertheticum]WAG63410.1 FUSC family protein [Clostridium estertheticum]